MSRFMSIVFFVALLCLACRADPLEGDKDSPQLLRPALYELQPGFSMLVFKVVKNQEIPVMASMNFDHGWLDPQRGQGPSGEIFADLSTWDSGLLLRDTRVVTVFFGAKAEAPDFIHITLKSLPDNFIQTMQGQGKPLAIKAPVMVELNGIKHDYIVDLSVTQIKTNVLAVKSTGPVMVKISDFGLTERLNTLKQLCGHKDVSDGVEVSFELRFAKVKQQ